MPYAIIHQNGKIVVVKKATGKVIGTHTSEADARAQIQAIYANTGELASTSEKITATLRKNKK